MSLHRSPITVLGGSSAIRSHKGQCWHNHWAFMALDVLFGAILINRAWRGYFGNQGKMRCIILLVYNPKLR